MIELLNSLYVQTQGSYLRLDHDTVLVEVEGQERIRVPLIRLGSIVVFGQVMVSPFLIQRCAEDGRSLVFLDRNGRFKARIEGPVHGNVLLRRSQHLALCDYRATTRIARQFVAAKVQNCRSMLLRAARDAALDEDAEVLAEAGTRLATLLGKLKETSDLDETRGLEGDAARTYFGVFGYMVRRDRQSFVMDGRSRRPPRDRVNAVLSFLYALLRGDCEAALESVGLDPQVGYLHALRPGRPALALDLMEELRPVLADRLALTLVNRGQLGEQSFEARPGGSVLLSDEGRKVVIEEYQQRKERKVEHRVLAQNVHLGLVPHVQARLLARHLRGDLIDYPPFRYRG
jgi:CRISPR-associated protein Cas1